MCSNWILLPLISSFIKPTEDELNFVGDLSQPDLSLSPEKLDQTLCNIGTDSPTIFTDK